MVASFKRRGKGEVRQFAPAVTVMPLVTGTVPPETGVKRAPVEREARVMVTEAVRGSPVFHVDVKLKAPAPMTTGTSSAAITVLPVATGTSLTALTVMFRTAGGHAQARIIDRVGESWSWWSFKRRGKGEVRQFQPAVTVMPLVTGTVPPCSGVKPVPPLSVRPGDGHRGQGVAVPHRLKLTKAPAPINLLGTSSVAITVLPVATGTSLTALTVMFMTEREVTPRPASLTV